MLRAVETGRVEELPSALHELYELAQHVHDLPAESLRAAGADREPHWPGATTWQGTPTPCWTMCPTPPQLEEIEDELFRFARVVESNPALRSALSDAAAPLESRERSWRDLLEAKVHPATLRLVRSRSTAACATWRRRSTGWRSRRRRARGWRVARVRIGLPIDDDERRALAEALERITHQPVELQVTRRSPALSGVP